MSTTAEYDRLLSQRDELRQHVGGLFEDPPSKQHDALVSYLSGELQCISHLCRDSPFSKITAVSVSIPIDTAAILLGSPAASSPSSVSASIPANQFIPDEAVVAEAVQVEASLSSPGMSLYSYSGPLFSDIRPFYGLYYSFRSSCSALLYTLCRRL